MVRIALVAWILAEIGMFALAGRTLGVWATLGLVVLTALAGAALLRAQGAWTLAALQGRLRAGGDPTALLLEGGFRLASAILLILPGFLGDILGLALLVPGVQRAATARLATRMRRTRQGAANLGTPPNAAGRGRDVIEAEWEEVGQPARPPRPPSGWTRR